MEQSGASFASDCKTERSSYAFGKTDHKVEEGFSNQITELTKSAQLPKADITVPITGYSDDHARKLRVVSNVLFGYNQFFKVALPVSFIINKINDTKAMLQVPESNAYWKQNFIIPSTSQLQQSQE